MKRTGKGDVEGHRSVKQSFNSRLNDATTNEAPNESTSHAPTNATETNNAPNQSTANKTSNDSTANNTSNDSAANNSVAPAFLPPYYFSPNPMTFNPQNPMLFAYFQHPQPFAAPSAASSCSPQNVPMPLPRRSKGKVRINKAKQDEEPIQEEEEKEELVFLNPVKLDPEQVADLEHVIRVGWRYRFNHERVQDYLQHKDDKPKKPRATDAVAARSDGLHLHAGDLRIYSEHHGYENHAWPLIKKRGRDVFLCDDKKWDEENGDGIHPLAFQALRLSSEIPRTKRQKYDLDRWSRLDLKEDAACVGGEHAQAALISRAWERAVHAAATTIPSDFQELPESIDMTYSVWMARQRCEHLGIKLPSKDKTLKCPSCKLTFGSYKLFQVHFYGKQSTYGCVWRLIHKQEKALVDRTLNSDVTSQIKLLVRQIVSSVEGRNSEEGGKSRKTEDLMNWKDILRILRKTLNRSVRFPERNCVNCNPLLETVQVSNDDAPLLMNPALLRSIERKVHERYANLTGKPR